MAEIRAIETQYKRRWYRSRHEARWAVFLDTLGEPFLYEQEGYELPPIPMNDQAIHVDPSHFRGEEPVFYVPDFWLPRVKQWVEIKPYNGPYGYDPLDMEKAKRLTFHTGYQTLLLCGTPALTQPGDGWPAYEGYYVGDCSYVWCECLYCGAVGLQYGGRSERLACCDPNRKREPGKWPNWNTSRLREAFTVAATQRFFLDHIDAVLHRNMNMRGQ